MDVKTLCLGALALGDATGYEIKKMFEEGEFSHFLEASYGSIYPALTRLTEEELLTCTTEVQDGRPDKKIYSLTPKGRDALSNSLADPIADDKFRSEFLFVMLFAHFLPREAVSRLIDMKISKYREELDRLYDDDQALPTPGSKFVRRFGQAVFEASVDYLENNRHLIEDRRTAGRQKETAATPV